VKVIQTEIPDVLLIESPVFEDERGFFYESHNERLFQEKANVKRIGAGVIHYSTDYVFNGHQTTPYTEQDEPEPQNTYGKTKLAGEKVIQAVGLPYLIQRTSWVYGLRGKNFLLTMLKLSQEREELKVVNDQVGTPIWSRMIAEYTAQILSQGTKYLMKFLEQ
jgi:dTDP-4-dehydrorhamnose reductase